MRRMYSKEQLNKLIEEVSKLIAIEELDKVVPVPDISKAGYAMIVNSAGTGYQLENIEDLQKPIYCHPLEIFESNVCVLTALVFNNSNEVIDSWTKLKAAIHSFGGANYNRLLVSGGFVKNNVAYIASEIVEYVASGKFYINAVSTSGAIITDYTLEITNEEFTSIVDSVNKIN